MNISANLTVRLAKNLPDLAQNNIRLGAVMWRFRSCPNFEPHQRRVCRPQDGWAQLGGGVVQ